MDRDKHCTVAQLKAVLANLRDDDLLCFVNPVSGDIDVFRGEGTEEHPAGKLIAHVGLSPTDAGAEYPDAELEQVLQDV